MISITMLCKIEPGVKKGIKQHHPVDLYLFSRKGTILHEHDY